MSNMNIRQGSMPISPSPQLQRTTSTPVLKPEPQVDESPTSEPTKKLTRSISQPSLGQSSVVDDIKESDVSPTQLQESSDELSGLQQGLERSVGVKPKVDTAPPPRLSEEGLRTTLTQHLGQDIREVDRLSTSLQNNIQLMDQSDSQIQLVEQSLEDNLKSLDKKKKLYNSPLYRLADKLGIKKRKLKLQNLQQTREMLQQTSSSMLALNQLRSETHQGEIQKLSSQLNDQIKGGRQAGQDLVTQNLDNKSLMWSLGLKSDSQLQESLAQSMVSELPGGEELLAEYDTLKQDYQTRKDSFDELQAQSSLYNNRQRNFDRQLKQLKETDPKLATELQQRFDQECVEFEQQVLLPLVEQAGSPDMLLKDDQGNMRVRISQVFQAKFDFQPPRLFDLLSSEQQEYITETASGIREALPNRKVDDDSLTLNGKSYNNRTFLAEAGFAKVYTYTSVDDPKQKIVVKEPHRPEGMSDDDYRLLLEDESVRELETHYHGMGVDGKGHDNMVKLLGAISTSEGPLAVMEFVDGGDGQKLKNNLSRLREEGSLDTSSYQKAGKHMLYQMMQGLEYMHQRGMTHLDVKYDNFLVQQDGTIKVTDFGLSKSVAQFKAKREDRGDNAIYLPPEMVGDTFKFNADGKEVSNKIDSWSVGIMMHQVLLEKSPRTDSSFMSKIENNTFEFGQDFNNRMIEDPQTPEEHLINKLLHPDPDQRITLSEALQDPVFDEIFEMNNLGKREGFQPEVVQLTQQIRSSVESQA